MVSVPRTPVLIRFLRGSGFRRTTRRIAVSSAIQRGRRFARVQWWIAMGVRVARSSHRTARHSGRVRWLQAPLVLRTTAIAL
jgi:hypothetical protein